MNNPAPDPSTLTPAANLRHTRYGLILFAFYLALYVGFMALAAFEPQIMARPVLGGVNLAIAYGIALILSAFFLALLYNWLCRKKLTSN